MPKKRGGRSTSAGTGGSGTGKVVFAFVLGAAVAAGAGYLYLHLRTTPRDLPTKLQAPVAAHPATVPASPGPHFKGFPPTAAAGRPVAPFGTSEDVFEAGARLYAARCASCHGTPTRDAASSPTAPQLWRKARHTAAAEAPGDLYTQIAAGAPAKGMPAYARVLTDTQIWQVALLLENAEVELPDPVVALLNSRATSSHPVSSGASR